MFFFGTLFRRRFPWTHVYTRQNLTARLGSFEMNALGSLIFVARSIFSWIPSLLYPPQYLLNLSRVSYKGSHSAHPMPDFSSFSLFQVPTLRCRDSILIRHLAGRGFQSGALCQPSLQWTHQSLLTMWTSQVRPPWRIYMVLI